MAQEDGGCQPCRKCGRDLAASVTECPFCGASTERSASHVPQSAPTPIPQSPVQNVTARQALSVVTAVAVLGVVVGLAIRRGASPDVQPSEPAISDPVFQVPSGMVPRYRLMGGTPQREGRATFLRAKIAVPGGLSRAELMAQIRHAARALYEQHHPTGMFVFAYQEGTDTSGEYTAGRCDFAPKNHGSKYVADRPLDQYEAKIDLADFYFNGAGQSTISEPKRAPASADALFAKWAREQGHDPDTRARLQARLSEDQRRAIYYEIAEANDRATAEANLRYPENPQGGTKAFIRRIGKRNQLEEDLIKRYETGVARRHRLTYREVRGIRYEGMMNHWPMPSDPEEAGPGSD